MALNDFTYILNKVRRVTGRLNASQLSDPKIQEYINSFLVYDLPLHTKFFMQKERFSLTLTPLVGNYPIAAFKNLYSNFEPPAYVDGYQIQYFQNDESFYQMFSQLKFSAQLSTGSGIAGPYNGTYQFTPVQGQSAVVSTTDANGTVMTATDDGIGGFVDETGAAIGGAVIDYITGIITGIVFTSAVPVGNIIYVAADRYIRGKPIAVLYFDDSFFFWPFPDRSYTFTIDAYKNPAAFTNGALFPELTQWADVIAFGTSLKIFQDNMDLDQYSKTMPFFDMAKRLAERRTLKQLSTQRVSTIYGDSEMYPQNWSYPFG